MSVLVLSVMRIIWRILNPPPPLNSDNKTYEGRLAHFVQLMFYIGMIVMPLIGWSIMSAHPPVGSIGEAAVVAARQASNMPPGGPPPGASLPPIWWIFPVPPLSLITDIGATPDGIVPQEELHKKLVHLHALGGAVMIFLLLLHIAGALKHQFIDGHAQLTRMGIG